MEIHNLFSMLRNVFGALDKEAASRNHDVQDTYNEPPGQPQDEKPTKAPGLPMSTTEKAVAIVLVAGFVAGLVCIVAARSVIKGEIMKRYQLPKNCVLRVLCGLLILFIWMVIRLVLIIPILLETVILAAVDSTTKYKVWRKGGLVYGPFAWMDGKLRHGVAIGLAWLFRGCRRARQHGSRQDELPPLDMQSSQYDSSARLEMAYHGMIGYPPAYGRHREDSLVTPPPPTYKRFAGDNECTVNV
ncbi:hypothetical protein ACHAQA_009891 [Verticillium albo-atrum]